MTPPMDPAAGGIVWEDPPRQHRATISYTELLEPLMERPLTWARIRDFASQGAASSVNDRLKKRLYIIPPGEWEFVTRKGEGCYYIYARFMRAETNGDTR